MAESQLQQLIEDLAAAVVLADPTPQSLGELARQIEALRPALEAAGALGLERLAGETAQLLGDAAGGGADADGALSMASLLVGEAQALAAPARQASAREARDPETLELLGDFLQEAEEHLSRADERIVTGERAGFDEEAIAELFRIYHSLKGLAGHFPDAREIAGVAHRTESLLERVRAGTLALEGELLEAVFAAGAAMRTLLGRLREAVEAGTPVAPSPQAAELLARIGRLVDEPAATPVVQDEAGGGGGARPSGAGGPAARLEQTVRVGLERVDGLLEAIGELTIVESMIAHAPELQGIESPRLRDYLAQLRRISRDLQDRAMQMRMVPVRGVFKRMLRPVRELAHRSGKDVVLELAGEATEMDRSMVEALEQPLLHLIRNAIDHGIEPAEERRRVGKPATARLRLSARHRGGGIVITVADDGAGLKRERILARARRLGLVAAGEQPGEAQTDALIFAPGFSTAGEVTEISGRGVGLDVVKRGVEALRGRVQVHSVPGRGTTFELVLPLTLAIIDGMLVACGAERYIVPSLSIVEALQVEPWMLACPVERGELLSVRDQVLPALRLGPLLGAPRPPESRPVAVVVESAGQQVALLVDAVLAQQQVVIKPLGEGVGRAELCSGAAILSDGRVGLILDVDRICGRRFPGSFESREPGTEEVSR